MEKKDAEHSVLYALLRSALWGETFDISLIHSDEQIRDILHEAHRQAVVGLVSYTLLYNAKSLYISEEMMRILNSLTLTIHQRHLKYNGVLTDVWDILQRDGVRIVLLKGQSVACNYPRPTLRECGDIDLYVSLPDFHKACDALHRISLHDESFHGHKHWHTEYKGVPIEIHKVTEILDLPHHNHRFQDWSVEQLTHERCEVVNVGNHAIDIPPIDYNAIYVFNHVWHHFMSGGIGLRHVCDWAMLLHKHSKRINIAELKNRLSSFGLLTPWRIFASIAVEYLGLPVEECPLYDKYYHHKAVKALYVIMRDGNLGLFAPSITERPKGYLNGKIHWVSINARRQFMLASITPKGTIDHYLSEVYQAVKAISAVW